MICTSAEANKLLKKLNDKLDKLCLKERYAYDFVAATTENLEDARPEYDYGATQKEIKALEYKIRKLKHGINIFNTTHVVEEFNMTVDELLVYMPLLTDRIDKLSEMVSMTAKSRLGNNGKSNIIEYRYANFDIPTVEADYNAAFEERARAQIELDKLNNSITMEIEL